jgi:hypothetical protein
VDGRDRVQLAAYHLPAPFLHAIPRRIERPPELDLGDVELAIVFRSEGTHDALGGPAMLVAAEHAPAQPRLFEVLPTLLVDVPGERGGVSVPPASTITKSERCSRRKFS